MPAWVGLCDLASAVHNSIRQITLLPGTVMALQRTAELELTESPLTWPHIFELILELFSSYHDYITYFKNICVSQVLDQSTKQSILNCVFEN